METTQRKLKSARAALWLTFNIALLLNLIEAWWDPDGQPWLILRITVSILFGTALVGYVLLWLLNRRSDPSDCQLQ
ncbi:hypothetical protein [Streptomyces sp. YS415]|uniref:hypothetical protein n=1 Tax=Streptomyces sp. YS415 TaxID=2944806 RepID=UPI00202042BC|nr:hypothetical protein [Streptomyces sp. YS415]MCL7427229.1 hypothetical protein [Streptomyces sp. YS415]